MAATKLLNSSLRKLDWYTKRIIPTDWFIYWTTFLHLCTHCNLRSISILKHSFSANSADIRRTGMRKVDPYVQMGAAVWQQFRHTSYNPLHRVQQLQQRPFSRMCGMSRMCSLAKVVNKPFLIDLTILPSWTASHGLAFYCFSFVLY